MNYCTNKKNILFFLALFVSSQTLFGCTKKEILTQELEVLFDTFDTMQVLRQMRNKTPKGYIFDVTIAKKILLHIKVELSCYDDSPAPYYVSIKSPQAFSVHLADQLIEQLFKENCLLSIFKDSNDYTADVLISSKLDLLLRNIPRGYILNTQATLHFLRGEPCEVGSLLIKIE